MDPDQTGCMLYNNAYNVSSQKGEASFSNNSLVSSSCSKNNHTQRHVKVSFRGSFTLASDIYIEIFELFYDGFIDDGIWFSARTRKRIHSFYPLI